MSTPEFNALKDDHRSELATPPNAAPTTAAPAYQHGKLSAEQLTRQPELDQLPTSTRRVQPLNDFLGQTRARAAVETALSLPFDGYNIFAVGTGGLGKRTMLKRLLSQHAAEMPTPNDWVYVNNFQDARRPIALALIAGEAPKFKKAMHQLWEKLFKQLDRTFSADSYHTRIESIRQQASQVQQSALLALTQEGEALNLMLVSDQEEHHFVPARPRDAQPRDQAEATPIGLDTLPAEQRAQVSQHMRQMDKKLERLGAQLGRIEEQTRDQVAQLNAGLASEIVLPKIQQIEQRFEHVDGLAAYLKAYTQDVIENVEDILAQEDSDYCPTMFDRVPARYQVNIMVSNKLNSGAPVVFEDLPTHYNLLGHVEQLTQMGTISTDFTLIRSGALHRANGGFLFLEAEQILEQPYAWQGLKRALRSRQIRLSSLEQMLTLTGSISLEPDSIPLSMKVVLLGEPQIYYELLEFEPELNRLFKIRADFSDTLPRTADNEQNYLRLIADYVHKKKLLPIDRSGLAELLVDSSRKAEDQASLSLHAASLGDLLCEANQLATSANAKQITAQHIQATVAERNYRLGYLRELYWHDLQRGTQLIETSGQRIGQINALTVVHYADSEFGLPARLTAAVYQGAGDILDIERSVDLGGALHAKGILIMSSFLRAHFGRTQPLHFSAALAFEQSYGEIDGDSATLAELSALISSISQLPIDQSWAITGSMNQLGMVQPIGGINAKIEGFYDTCVLQGLTGKQGVIFPALNTQHLMLRADVIEAVQQGKFHLHAVDRVEQALELLIGQPAGQMNAQGKYPKGSIFAEVMRQLKHWQALEHEPEQSSKKRKKKAKVSKDKPAEVPPLTQPVQTDSEPAPSSDDQQTVTD